MIFVFAFLLLVYLIVSYKKGKMINGYFRFGESPFIDRKLDPEGYWAMFIIFSLLCAFITGCAIWVLIYGTAPSNGGTISN